MTKTIVGLFDDIEESREVVRELIDAGIDSDEISFVTNNANNEPISYEGGDDTSGTATGAGFGAIIGGIGGLLVGIGAFAIPGVGPVVGAGWLVATFMGAGIGAIAGGLLGALVDAGVPEEDAQYYSEGVRRGGTLIAVRTSENNAERVTGIMYTHGAVDINKRGADYRERGYTGYNPNAQPMTAAEVIDERQRYRSGAASDINIPFSGHRL